jgi:hypothetical protein
MRSQLHIAIPAVAQCQPVAPGRRTPFIERTKWAAKLELNGVVMSEQSELAANSALIASDGYPVDIEQPRCLLGLRSRHRVFAKRSQNAGDDGLAIGKVLFLYHLAPRP